MRDHVLTCLFSSSAAVSDLSLSAGAPAPKPDRTFSPGGPHQDERRELIARQCTALYDEGPSGGYVDENGMQRPGMPGHHNGPAANIRDPSPLAYDYGRTPPVHSEAGPQPATEQGAQYQRERTSSNASPQSNPSGNKGPFDGPVGQQVNRTSNSSPGGSPNNGKPHGGTVAPIGTRPSGPSTGQGPPNPALSKRSTTPLPSPLSQGYNASGGNENVASGSSAAPTNPQSASTEGPVGGLSGWGQRSGGWSQKSNLGVQASVWG